MREIKYRAKNKLGNWHFGSVVHITKFTDNSNCDMWQLVDEHGVTFSCDTSTLGQFTGVYDKNKLPIFERRYSADTR